MLHQTDLDHAIDAAAGAMTAREPSRSLGYAVMARVREREVRAPRRFVWLTAAASLVLCGGLAIALMSRTPATMAPVPPSVPLVVAQPPVTPVAAVAMIAEALPARSVTREFRPVIRVATRAPLPRSDVSPIELIQTDPIVLSSLDVPQLEGETTTIDALNVEPLTIEPLAASND